METITALFRFSRVREASVMRAITRFSRRIISNILIRVRAKKSFTVAASVAADESGKDCGKRHYIQHRQQPRGGGKDISDIPFQAEQNEDGGKDEENLQHVEHPEIIPFQRMPVSGK
ncbi:MAG: hypothetical protein U0411_01000 [Thermodesulfovibrionales bacterium]